MKEEGKREGRKGVSREGRRYGRKGGGKGERKRFEVNILIRGKLFTNV